MSERHGKVIGFEQAAKQYHKKTEKRKKEEAELTKQEVSKTLHEFYEEFLPILADALPKAREFYRLRGPLLANSPGFSEDKYRKYPRRLGPQLVNERTPEMASSLSSAERQLFERLKNLESGCGWAEASVQLAKEASVWILEFQELLRELKTPGEYDRQTQNNLKIIKQALEPLVRMIYKSWNDLPKTIEEGERVQIVLMHYEEQSGSH